MVFEQITKLGAGLWSDFGELGLHALRGDQVRVREVLQKTDLREVATTDEYYPLFLANGLALVGDTDEALQWLEQAISWGFTNHRFLSQHNRFLAPLRGDSRFQALMDRAREKERAFEV